MIDTIIFDLDGTLLDTVDDLVDSVNYAMKYFNYPLKTKEEVRHAVGSGLVVLMERMLPSGSNIYDVIEKFKEYYIQIKVSKTKPYDHIIELLQTLKKRGYKIGVVSNKFDRGTKQNCKYFFKDLIDYAQGEDELNGILRKPSPIGVYKVVEKLNSKIENCIFVGDSEVDIQTAKNANIPCISVLWGLKTKEFLINNGAKLLIDDPLEILSMV